MTNRMDGQSLSVISEANEKLTNVISELEAILSLDIQLSCDAPSEESVLTLSRRLTPSTIPPLFLRFNGESGPLEALPARFHVPFPTLEELRYSVLNSQPAPARPRNQSAEDEEYANDF